MDQSRQKSYPPRKNQQTLDFLDSLKHQLGDANHKSFGLYMKLFKEHGQQKMETALFLTLRNNQVPLSGKMRYFLAILMDKGYKKQSRAEYREQTKKRKQTEAGAAYEEMKSVLLKKMIPEYERRANIRSRLLHKVAKQERGKTYAG